MQEDFVGVKFEAFLDNKPVSFSLDGKAKAVELVQWCKRFEKEGLAPSFESGGALRSAGNISFRVGGGFVITPSGGNFANDAVEDLVLVESFDFKAGKVFAQGLHYPSSESLLHALVYKNRPDVSAVFHGHDNLVLEKAGKLGLVRVPKLPYGSKELAEAVSGALSKTDFVAMNGHGFVSVGKSMAAAGEKALTVHENARV